MPSAAVYGAPMQGLVAPPAQQPMGQIIDVRKQGAKQEEEADPMMSGFASLGPFMLGLLIFIPVWQCMGLLHNHVYLFFAAREEPVALLILIGLLLIVLLAQCLFRFQLPFCPACPETCFPDCGEVACEGCRCCPNPFLAVGFCFARTTADTCCAFASGVVLLIVWGLWYVEENESGSSSSSGSSPSGGGASGADDESDDGAFRRLVLAIPRCAAWFWSLADAAPMAVVVAGLAVLLLYTLTLSGYSRFARKRDLEEGSSLMTIWGSFMLMVGVLFVILSIPLNHEAISGHQEIFNSCETGPRTHELYITSQSLQALRSTPSCANEISVEYCSGYFKTPYSVVLKHMERQLKCSGFCYNPGALLLPNSTSASLLVPGASFPAGGPAPPLSNVVPYAPSLFSLANYEASCDGMTARMMRHVVGGIAEQIFWEGVLLVSVSVFVGLLMLGSTCKNRDAEGSEVAGFKSKRLASGYGAAQI